MSEEMIMNQELLAKAKEARSVEEILTFARENGIELTEEQAEALFARLHSDACENRELPDEELEKAAGGLTAEGWLHPYG